MESMEEAVATYIITPQILTSRQSEKDITVTFGNSGQASIVFGSDRSSGSHSLSGLSVVSQ